MILNSLFSIDDTKQFKFYIFEQKLYCLVNLTEHKKDKEKWHFCLLRGRATFTKVSLMNNKLKIAILKYRTLIKRNWTKQEQRNSEICWMNQFFFSRNIAVLSKMRRLTSISSVRTLFWDNTFFTFSDLILLNKISSTEIQITILFTYQFKWTAKCVYTMSNGWVFRVLSLISLTWLAFNIVTVLNKLGVPIHK